MKKIFTVLVAFAIFFAVQSKIYAMKGNSYGSNIPPNSTLMSDNGASGITMEPMVNDESIEMATENMPYNGDPGAMSGPMPTDSNTVMTNGTISSNGAPGMTPADSMVDNGSFDMGDTTYLHMSTDSNPGGMSGLMPDNEGYHTGNGMLRTLLVGVDGTTYIVSDEQSMSMTPSSDMFQSRLFAVHPDGQKTVVRFDGAVSQPAVTDGMLVIAATMPNQQDLMAADALSLNGESLLHIVSLPLSEVSTVITVPIEGHIKSAPVIANDLIYVTAGSGSFMNWGDSQSMFGENIDQQQGETVGSFLYIFDYDGTLMAKVAL